MKLLSTFPSSCVFKVHEFGSKNKKNMIMKIAKIEENSENLEFETRMEIN